MVIVFTIFNVQTGDMFQSVALKFTWYDSAPFAYSRSQIILYTVSKEQMMLGRSIASVDIVHQLSLGSAEKRCYCSFSGAFVRHKYQFCPSYGIQCRILVIHALHKLPGSS